MSEEEDSDEYFSALLNRQNRRNLLAQVVPTACPQAVSLMQVCSDAQLHAWFGFEEPMMIRSF